MSDHHTLFYFDEIEEAEDFPHGEVIDSRDLIGNTYGPEIDAEIEEAAETPDWRYGERLIRDDYFIEYARQLADEIGAVDADARWPNSCIDWEKAAEQLQQDFYSSVQIEGVTYWVRS